MVHNTGISDVVVSPSYSDRIVRSTFVRSIHCKSENRNNVCLERNGVGFLREIRGLFSFISCFPHLTTLVTDDPCRRTSSRWRPLFPWQRPGSRPSAGRSADGPRMLEWRAQAPFPEIRTWKNLVRRFDLVVKYWVSDPGILRVRFSAY